MVNPSCCEQPMWMWVCLHGIACHTAISIKWHTKSGVELKMNWLNSDQFRLSIPIQFQFKNLSIQFQFNSWIDPSPALWGIHRSPMDSPHKGQWRGAFMFTLICALTHGWTNNGDAGDLRSHRAHYDGTVTLELVERNLSHQYIHWYNTPLLIIVGEWRISSLNLAITISDNGLSPVRHQTIIWTNASLLSIKSQGTYRWNFISNALIR